MPNIPPNRFSSIFSIIGLAFLLAACSSRPGTGALAVNLDPAIGASEQTLLVATTRQRDTAPDTYFNGERSEKLVDFAAATVSVPPTHKAGEIEWPSSPPGNPNTDFVVRSAAYIEGEDAFLRKLNAQISALPPKEQNITLFIHGYNTNFPESLFRITQIVHDNKGGEVPVLFSWASGGQLQDYVYDLNSAAIARDALEKTLVLLARSKAKRILILAHSMGNYLLMEMAARLTPENRRLIDKKLQMVVMAAPDIDIDLFKSNLKRIGKAKQPYVLVLSKDDRALRLSRTIAGGKDRLGAYSNDTELADLGAIVFDLTELESIDAARHGKFAQLAQYGSQLARLVQQTHLKTLSEDSSGSAETDGGTLGSAIGDAAKSVLNLPIRLTTSAQKTTASSN